VDSDADDDVATDRPGLGLEQLKLEVLNALRQNLFQVEDEETHSAIEQPDRESNLPSALEQVAERKKKRRNTLPTTRPQDRVERSKRKRPKSLIANYFLSLTPEQAMVRKWVYAGVLYVVMITLVLVPIRIIIARFALEGAEPFGWAVGYLFGNVREVRFWIVSSSLERWIPLPPLEAREVSRQTADLGQANFIRQAVVGAANTRLAICAYCVGILMIGMVTLLRLTSLVEVDTRRKLFHGMMVAMMLPTIYIDPTFIALALVLVLALFLIFDLIRASQLPPLSKPLAYFLTPYVDGRDLRGPVVISHIFLLIGCAVPLWLSLAGTPMSDAAPWRGWETESRDVSMVAGVVCVGMGDAAASLVGRRYGRHKWLWSGGKSLEGSVAFAVAVTVGLGAGKIWLVLGGWKQQQQRSQGEWISSLAKIGLSACGASFNEAVLTGGNDNVVVPVVLWLLVRGLEV
jgi:dolichol kinase